MLKRIFPMLMAGLLLAFTNPAAAETSAMAAVRTSVEAILEILNNDQLDKTAKRERMRDTIKGRFDFRAMSQRTLATNWRKASSEERQQFVDLFSQLVENSYVGKIEAYTDEKVEFPGSKIKGKKAVVDTLIITASADIPVNYKLYRKNGEWLVYDVIIEGVSLISNYRSSYQEIVKKEGLTGLLGKMQNKIDELAAGPEAQPS